MMVSVPLPLRRSNVVSFIPKSFHCGMGRSTSLFHGASPQVPISRAGLNPAMEWEFKGAVCHWGISFCASKRIFDSGRRQLGTGLPVVRYAG